LPKDKIKTGSWEGYGYGTTTVQNLGRNVNYSRGAFFASQ
jgi:hypothetical protein